MELTKPQKLIYDMEKFAGGSIAVICGSMLVKGNMEISVLQHAANELYRLNDALRIKIREADGKPYQEIIEYKEQDIPVLRFDSKAELDFYADKYAKKPLVLFGNLFEISIVLLPDNYGILVKQHHIIGDAWTISLIGNQFITILNGDTPIAYSYDDYIESERKYLNSNRYTKDRDYFIKQFIKCDEVTYLSDNQSGSFSAARKTFVIDKAKAKDISEYVRRKNTSAFMLFTAVLATYINRIKMNTERFYIGTAVLNRSGVKEKNTMGMFINTVPMLIELDNSKSFSNNLSSVQSTVFSILRHQKYNYGDLLSSIRKDYGFSEKLYDVVISYQNATIGAAKVETTWYFSGMQTESLQVHIDDRDNEGIFCIHYDYLCDSFTENEIDLLHKHILNLLLDAIKDDSIKLFELMLLT